MLYHLKTAALLLLAAGTHAWNGAKVTNTAPYPVSGVVEYVSCVQTHPFQYGPLEKYGGYEQNGGTSGCLVKSVTAKMTLPEGAIITCTPYEPLQGGVAYTAWFVWLDETLIAGPACHVWRADHGAPGLSLLSADLPMDTDLPVDTDLAVYDDATVALYDGGLDVVVDDLVYTYDSATVDHIAPSGVGKYPNARMTNVAQYPATGTFEYASSAICHPFHFGSNAALTPFGGAADHSRGVCLITKITAQLKLSDNTTMQCQEYHVGGGTAYSDFVVWYDDTHKQGPGCLVWRTGCITGCMLDEIEDIPVIESASWAYAVFGVGGLTALGSLAVGAHYKYRRASRSSAEQPPAGQAPTVAPEVQMSADI